MSAVESATKAIEQLKPSEFEEFLVWLSQRVSDRLGGRNLSVESPSARERVEAFESAVTSGESEPFRYVDVDRLPEKARKKAQSIVAEWRSQYGG